MQFLSSSLIITSNIDTDKSNKSFHRQIKNPCTLIYGKLQFIDIMTLIKKEIEIYI